MPPLLPICVCCLAVLFWSIGVLPVVGAQQHNGTIGHEKVTGVYHLVGLATIAFEASLSFQGHACLHTRVSLLRAAGLSARANLRLRSRDRPV